MFPLCMMIVCIAWLFLLRKLNYETGIYELSEIYRTLYNYIYIGVIIITVQTVALSSCMAIATAYNDDNKYHGSFEIERTVVDYNYGRIIEWCGCMIDSANKLGRY